MIFSRESDPFPSLARLSRALLMDFNAPHMEDASFWNVANDIYQEMAAIRVAAGENARNQAIAHLRIPEAERRRNRYVRPVWIYGRFPLPMVDYRAVWLLLRDTGPWAILGHIWVGVTRLVRSAVVSTFFLLTVGWFFSAVGQLLMTAANLSAFSDSAVADFKTYALSGSSWVLQQRAALFHHGDDVLFAIPPATLFPTPWMIQQVLLNSLVIDLDISCHKKTLLSGSAYTVCSFNTDSLLFAFDRVLSSKLSSPVVLWLVPLATMSLFILYVLPPTVLLVNMASYVAGNVLSRVFLHLPILESISKAAWRSADI